MRGNITFLLGSAVLAAPLFFAQAPPSVKTASLRELSASYEALAAQVRPAVVQIFSTGYAAVEDSESNNTSSLLSRQRSTGSGVILSPDGYIVTNNHVVQGARRIEVRLAMRDRNQTPMSTIPAKLIGADRETDLAVIKVDVKGLPALKLGDSNELRQGQLVMAFGNPLGLEGSATVGIVSSLARRLQAEDPLVYIQTDAPINPGNSGGPLVDSEGRVVGINTLILSRSGGSEGIGFAIPSNAVRNTYDQIRKDGHVHRGQIGIVAETISPVMAKGLGLSMAKGLGLSQDWGVIVSDVTPDGPADKEGMKVGDIIKSLNGRPMDDAPQLETSIYRLTLAEVVNLTVLRGGQTLNVTIPVVEREDDPQRFADMVNPEDNLIPKLGILAIEINEKLSKMLPDLRHDYGIVIAARAANAPYTGAGLEVGDVIYEVNKTPAVTIPALRATLDKLKSGDPVVLQVERRGKLRYIAIELE